MHALIKSGAVDQYPYTIGNLRKDNPNTSFPKRPSDTLLAEWGVQPVAKIDRPIVDHTKNVAEGTPVLVDGTWTQVWETTDATAEEIAEREQARLNAMVVTRAEFAKAAKREGIISHAEAIAWATQQALPQIVLDVFATLPQADREDAEFLRKRLINAIFFWQDDHCEWAWRREVEEARKTLERAKSW